MPDYKLSFPVECLLLLSVAVISLASCSYEGQTILSIDGQRFRVNGELFDMWGVRVASASQNDTYTKALISNLNEYKAYGINTVTVFVQGSSGGFSDPFSADGNEINSEHLRRIKEIIEGCDRREMVAVVGIFYQRTMANYNRVRKLDTPKAVIEATRTITRELSRYTNIIINIANEQNSSLYRNDNMRYATGIIYNFNDTDEIIDLCNIVHEIDPHRIVGAGGYDDAGNITIGNADSVDVLLFDTFSRDIENGQGSGWHYDYFRSNGVSGKPIVNVEMFGGWTKTVPQGVYIDGLTRPDNENDTPRTNYRKIHLDEVDQAIERPGLSVFFHSNNWFQGRSLGIPGIDNRFNLGGAGTCEKPGVRWYFEYVRQAICKKTLFSPKRLRRPDRYN